LFEFGVDKGRRLDCAARLDTDMVSVWEEYRLMDSVDAIKGIPALEFILTLY
jgi:hypothetical protein